MWNRLNQGQARSNCKRSVDAGLTSARGQSSLTGLEVPSSKVERNSTSIIFGHEGKKFKDEKFLGSVPRAKRVHVLYPGFCGCESRALPRLNRCEDVHFGDVCEN